MDTLPPSATKRLGLFPSRTNLPCMLWLRRAPLDPGPGGCPVTAETTRTRTFEQPTLFEIDPWFHRKDGPFVWLDLACLGMFVRDNLPKLQGFWRGELAANELSRAIKPLPCDLRQAKEDMAARIDLWVAAMEAQFRETGVLDLGYASHRALLVDTGALPPAPAVSVRDASR